ncbi:MAG TPA: SGNH/GDSL hydrolase family protein, partial [Thermodesulfobacteriota bacterium]|nr:SGNH/GDSL hydrolase family protein [Thermodesulfobacteriota bacterium]
IAFTLISLGCDSSDLTGDEDDITYLAVGASDALGVGAIPEDDGYVFIIERELDDAYEEDVDLCPICLVALPAAELEDIEVELNIALDAGVEPDIVTILVGANDIIAGVDPADFKSQLREVISEILDASPDAFIAIGNVPDLTQLPRFDDGEDPDVTIENIMAFNDVIEEVAAEFGISQNVVDLFSQVIEEDFVADDGFHPSDKGHERIAQLFLEVILDGFDPSTASSDSASPLMSPFPSPSITPSMLPTPSP